MYKSSIAMENPKRFNPAYIGLGFVKIQLPALFQTLKSIVLNYFWYKISVQNLQSYLSHFLIKLRFYDRLDIL